MAKKSNEYSTARNKDCTYVNFIKHIFCSKDIQYLIKVVGSSELSKIHIGMRIDEGKNPELRGCH